MLINENLDKKLKEIQETNNFSMTSYVVYMLAQSFKYRGLTCKGIVGENKFYECYPQLHLSSTSHYRRANDAFTMYITSTLQEAMYARLSVDSI
jgi:hypothetical protein